MALASRSCVYVHNVKAEQIVALDSAPSPPFVSSFPLLIVFDFRLIVVSGPASRVDSTFGKRRMNIEIRTEIEKTRLRRRFAVKVAGWLFPILLVSLLLLEVLPFWFL